MSRARIVRCVECSEPESRHLPTCSYCDPDTVASAGGYSVAPGSIRALSPAGRRWFRAAGKATRLPALRRVDVTDAGEGMWRGSRRVVTQTGKRQIEEWLPTDYRVRVYRYAGGELRLRVDEHGELLPAAREYLDRVGIVAVAVDDATGIQSAADGSGRDETCEPTAEPQTLAGDAAWPLSTVKRTAVTVEWDCMVDWGRTYLATLLAA